jgi:site-specific DNA recombinase
MKGDNKPVRRCAVYTRKSSEEGLEQDFNSLDAQREACEAYIRSQASEGWRLVTTTYDDGGISGGTMERPGLQRLLVDIRARKVDVVAIYKVDRLSRSLMDFLKMIEEFDRLGVSVVAITQQFNTTTSMGRLTLNILLSFAQFEREVTTERIRDKIAASKRKGMWMGGNLPLGYDVEHRKLVINREEAERVKLIYQRYLELGCVRLLQQDLDKRQIRSKARVSQAGKRSGGCAFSRGALYTLLANPIYVGDIRHKDAQYDGQHDAILDRALWEKVQHQLTALGTARRGVTGKGTVSPLAGKLFDANGNRLVPSHAVKKGRRYRYYISPQLVSGRAKDAEAAWRVPASEIEAAVAAEAARVLEEPATIAGLITSTSIDRQHAKTLVQRFKSCANRLKDDDQRIGALADIVQRVEIADEKISLDLSAADVAPEVVFGDGGGVIRRDIALALKRHGVETRLVIGGIESRPVGADPGLIRLLSRAFSWWESIENGEITIERIAKREKLTGRYLRDILQLAFLAPEIVEGAVRGGPTKCIRSDTLMAHPVLPIVWQEQVAMFPAAAPR